MLNVHPDKLSKVKKKQTNQKATEHIWCSLSFGLIDFDCCS